MTRLKWDQDQLTVGISAMDEEHKVLVGLINALDQKNAQHSTEVLERIFSTLEFYVKNHFAHEERIMEKMNYPKLAEHRKQHKIFISNLYKLNDRFAKGELDTEFVDKLTQFIAHWITDHIMKEDKHYGKYLTE